MSGAAGGGGPGRPDREPLRPFEDPDARRRDWERQGLWPTPTGRLRSVVRVAFVVVLIAWILSFVVFE